MKPIHKFNNGNGATLCHKCNCIISIGFTDDLYCKECIKEQYKKMYSEEKVELLIYNVCGEVARLQGITLNGNHIATAYKKFKNK